MRTAFLTAVPNQERVAFTNVGEDEFLNRALSHIDGKSLAPYRSDTAERGVDIIVWADPDKVISLAGVSNAGPDVDAMVSKPRSIESLQELTEDPRKHSWLMFRDVPMLLFIGNVVVTGKYTGDNNLVDLGWDKTADWFTDSVIILHAEVDGSTVMPRGERVFVTAMKQVEDARFRSVI